MSLNSTAAAERIHIGFFGMRNAGKSSIVNAVTGQDLAVVSEIMGTTTDPVKKSMELLPLGPVVIIDTPGIDDEGVLGEMRVKKAKQALNYTDIAVLTIDACKGLQEADRRLIALFKDKKIPYIIAYNKADLPEIKEKNDSQEADNPSSDVIYVSAQTKQNIYELKEMIARIAKKEESRRHIAADLLQAGDLVVLVVPIDSSAPKGRLILPQQQTILDILDAGAIAAVSKETDLAGTFRSFAKKPKLVITDSQAFGQVSKDTPDDILLTSFSILFARYKGNLNAAVEGAAQLNRLQDGDTVLISEGCTHHRQCGDIGTEKLPAWIKNYTKKEINFAFTSGTEFPEELSQYALIIHCGGCMLNEREMQYRFRHAADCGIPITNYGIAIAQIHGILKRSLQPFPEIMDILTE